MNKKILASLLITTMTLTILSGCGSRTPAPDTTSSKIPSESSTNT